MATSTTTSAFVDMSHHSEAVITPLNSGFVSDTSEFTQNTITESQQKKVAAALKEQEYTFEQAEQMLAEELGLDL